MYPPALIRHVRLITRQRHKLGGMLASKKNRLGIIDAMLKSN